MIYGRITANDLQHSQVSYMHDNLTTIARKYADKTPGSAALYRRAVELFPSGVTHDARYLKPHPVYIDRAQGARKWDVDGNEYVDYFGGHAALIMGHNHPAIVDAVNQQLSKGAHYGASHELEVEWAELITQLVPSAEKVRFTSSGTEASLLGMRIARAFTGKNKIVRFLSHFHGWHDQISYAVHSHFDGSLPAGVPPGTERSIILCPPNDENRLREILESSDDIAGVILEPTGSSFGRVPSTPEHVETVRNLTREHDVLLIFDEVISGFRVAPGGAQDAIGVMPDLTLLAKAVAGGFPGAAVVGRADVMDIMAYREDADWNRDRRITHFGTFNANPVCASAGVAALKLIATGEPHKAMNDSAEKIRRGMNQVIREQGLNWLVYGRHSQFHVFPNCENEDVTLSNIYSGTVPYDVIKNGTTQANVFDVRTGMLLGGVDLAPSPCGWVSAVHSPADIDQTIDAFETTLKMWKEEHAVSVSS
jgi:glutamate-1-semialdehyde 2,1-aminomutase